MVYLRSSSGDEGILSPVSNYPVVRKGKSAASDAVYVSKRLRKGTGKAAWTAATSLIIFGIPLIVEMNQEAQFVVAELQQVALLGGSGSGSANPSFTALPS